MTSVTTASRMAALPPISVLITRWNSPSAPVESFTQLNHNEIIMVQNDPDTRAQDLLDEIRRRSGELTRPLEELDYLKRLLQMF